MSLIDTALVASLICNAPIEAQFLSACYGNVHRLRVAETMRNGTMDPEITTLVQALRDDNPRNKIKAAFTLGTLGEAAVVPLMAALGDEDVGVRWNAAFAIRSVGMPAVESLIRCLEEGNPHARAPACWVLGMISDHRAIPALMHVLQDESEQVRQEAAEALRKIRRRGTSYSTTAIRPLEG